MCGINGIFAYHYASNPVDRKELIRTRDYMAFRGPDGAGDWISDDRHAALGHRRLAIIDFSERAAQPMSSPNGQLVVTFNGEIYNYRELRRKLEAKGYAFHSNSDTEVLLHLYADRREGMLQELRGMFAFAIYDAVRKTMFLARDPYGIKPLYYADDGWTFRFASQVKALLAGRHVSRGVDPAGVVGFYLFGSVPEPFTTNRSIRSLPAGTSMCVTALGSGNPKPYHSLARVLTAIGQEEPSSADAIISALRESLLDSVRHHLVADVSVGAFLSSGIDSATLVAMMTDIGQRDIQTVTIAFDEFQNTLQDEAPLAERISRRYGTRHSTRVVTKQEFLSDMPAILDAMDQPTIDGVNTWFVSKAAHELSLKVAISGVGGDELFGGYPSFSDIPRWVKRVRPTRYIPFLGKAAREIFNVINSGANFHPKAASFLEYGGTYPGAYLLRRGIFMPWELREFLDEEFVAQGLERLAPIDRIGAVVKSESLSPFAKVSVMEASLYMRNQLLRDTDWASMAHSLEVRVPFVDSVLLSKCASLCYQNGGELSKKILMEGAGERLPSRVASRAKTGFTTPAFIWHLESLGMRMPGHNSNRANIVRSYARAIGDSVINLEMD